MPRRYTLGALTCRPARSTLAKEDLSPLDPGRNLAEEVVEKRHRWIGVTCGGVKSRRSQAKAPRQGRIREVSSAASSQSSAAAAVAPRAAA